MAKALVVDDSRAVRMIVSRNMPEMKGLDMLRQLRRDPELLHWWW